MRILQLSTLCCVQDIYESWPGRCCLVLDGSRLGLRFATEAGVQELVAGLRQTWQHSRAGKQIEVT